MMTAILLFILNYNVKARLVAKLWCYQILINRNELYCSFLFSE